MRHRAHTSGLCIAVALMAAVPTSVPASHDERASFHTVLVASFPAADSTQRGETREIRLRYSTAVQPALSTITLTGPAGPLPVGAVEAVPGSQDAEIRVSLRAALPSGSYRVDWRTAGPDNHPITGSFAFAVERPAAADTPAGDPAGVGEPPASGSVPVRLSPTPAHQGEPGGFAPLALLIQSVFFVSIIGMLGALLFRSVVLTPLARDPLLVGTVPGAAARARALAWVAGGLALVSAPARLAHQSSGLFGPAAFQSDNLVTLLGTGWGSAWYLETAAAALFVVGLIAVGGYQDRAAGWWLMSVAALGMSFVPALSGHAFAEPARVRAIAVVNDALHVAAAGAWLGTLAVLLLVGLSTARAPIVADGAVRGLPPLARMVNAFSRMALLAVAALVATGVVNAWLRLGSFSALYATGYGRTLIVKLVLVTVAAAIGFYNWRVVRPALAQEAPSARLRTSAAAEVSLGVAVVIVTALLVATPPP